MTEEFHYTHNGQGFSLPYLGRVKAGLLRKIRKLSADDQLFTLLEEMGNDEALAVIDEMDGEEFGEFLTAWHEASGVTMGESQASSTS